MGIHLPDHCRHSRTGSQLSTFWHACVRISGLEKNSKIGNADKKFMELGGRKLKQQQQERQEIKKIMRPPQIGNVLLKDNRIQSDNNRLRGIPLTNIPPRAGFRLAELSVCRPQSVELFL